MKKILLFALIALIFAGCKKDELETPNVESEPDNPEQIDPLELFYSSRTFGFRVNDTSNLDLIHSYAFWNDSIIFLTGRRNEKLWIDTFNTQTKEQVSEFVDDEKLDLNQKIHAGYGEYADIVVSEIEFSQFIDKYGFIAVNVKLHKEPRSEYKSLVLFKDKSNLETKRYYYDNSSLVLEEWYNESYKVGIYNSITSASNITIFDKNGAIIIEQIDGGGGSVEMAVSYTDYIWIGFLWQNDTQLTILRTWMGKHSLNNNRWEKYMPILQDGRNSKYSYNIIKNENKWIFKFDVIDYSGEKHSHEIKLDIETGEQWE
jgi:hypothetical protein